MVTKIEQFGQSTVEQPDELVAYKRQFEEIRQLIWAPSVPGEMLLGSLRDGRLRVQAPIKVKLMSEGEHVIAEAPEFNEFGFGRNWPEALIELQRAIAELYFTLHAEQHRLGSDLQSVWAILQQKIRRR